VTRLNVLLVIVTVVCALLLITSQNKARRLFNQLELEQEKTRQLDVEWGQLQLEQSTWATPSRVEKLARERLHMLAPDARRTVVTPLPAARGNAAGAAPRAPDAGASGERQ
jgi:cell division protein FtsL